MGKKALAGRSKALRKANRLEEQLKLEQKKKLDYINKALKRML